MKFRRVAIAAIVVAVIISAAAWQGSARAATVGPNLPSSGADDAGVGTVVWSSPSAVTATDGTVATADIGKNAVSHYLYGSGYGFALPSNAQIDGVQVTVTGYSSDGSSRAELHDSSVRLSVGGVASGTNHATDQLIGTSSASYVYGGSADNWGLTLTGADVNAAGFGVLVSWINVSTGPGGTETGSIDSITVTLTYTVPNSTPSAPSITAPANGATGVSVTPVFQLAASDAENDYLQYNIDVYASDCSTPVAFFDQSISQTGWSGQDQAGGTAYTGSSTLASSTVATYTTGGAFANSTTYCWRASAIDPAGSNSYGAWSGYQTFTTASANSAAAAPTLSLPAAAAIGVALKPVFKLSTTDANSDPVQYSMDLCSDALCSSVINTFDQTVTPSGWSGQDAESGTAYSTAAVLGSSRTATYTYSGTFLSPETTYWWRGRAKAVSGDTAWSGYSSISSFTTASSSTTLRGGVTITGGVDF